MPSLQRVLCVTTYVINRKGEFLLLFHRKLNKWVPPGGKVESDETPDAAAMRECYEETGVSIELIGNRPAIDGGLVTPLGIQLNSIIKNERDHVDILYVGRPVASEELIISDREASAIGWMSYEKVLQLDTFPSVVHWCQCITEQEKAKVLPISSCVA
jgi:8-oxo-dGTP diphosphatase